MRKIVDKIFILIIWILIMVGKFNESLSWDWLTCFIFVLTTYMTIIVFDFIDKRGDK